MPKLQTLQPRLKEVDLSRGLQTVEDLRPPLSVSDIRTRRWTKSSNGRVLPLTSDAWRKLRRSVLAGEPLCRMCTARGLTVVATDVDHANNNPADNSLVNLQPLCHECHSRKTASDMGGNVRMGCTTDGQPLDPHHHWNSAAKAVLVRPDGAVDEKSPATERRIPSCLSSFNANSESVA